MTNTVVLNTLDSIVTTNNAISTVTNNSVDLIVTPTEYYGTIVNNYIGNVVVEKVVDSVLLAGQAGPKGAPGISEEDMVYSKRIDFTTESTLYKGEALVGSLEVSAVWRIRYIVIGNDGDVSETWASGNANFDKVWANRASLSYS